MMFSVVIENQSCTGPGSWKRAAVPKMWMPRNVDLGVVGPRGFFLVASLSLLMTARGQSCQTTAEPGYDFELLFSDDGIDIFWTIPEDTVSFLVRSEAEAWVGIGFSEDAFMIGSDAVVALPDTGAVTEYELASKDVDFTTPSSIVDISETTVEQVDGLTTFTFTRNTTPDGNGKLAIPTKAGEDINLLWAQGFDNTFGYHGSARLAFVVDLFCPTAVVTTTTTSAETPSPTAAESTAPIMTVTPSPSTQGISFPGTSAPTLGTISPQQLMDTAVPTASPTVSERDTGATSSPTTMPTDEDTSTPAPGSTDGGGGIGRDTPSPTSGTRAPVMLGFDTGAPTNVDESVLEGSWARRELPLTDGPRVALAVALTICCATFWLMAE